MRARRRSSAATGGFLIEAPVACSRRRAPRAAPEAAQQKPPAPERGRPRARITVKPIDAEEGGPDETALRFYAAQNQMKRVAIEIERLRRLYPYGAAETLVEPASTSSEDEQPLWDLFGADRLEELRIAIEQRQKRGARSGVPRKT